MSDFWQFLTSVFSSWWTLVTGVVFVLDQSLKWLWPRGKVMLDAKWPADRRRPVEIALLFFLFAWASFSAYQKELKAHQAENVLAAGKAADAAYWKGRALALQAEIATKKPTTSLAPGAPADAIKPHLAMFMEVIPGGLQLYAFNSAGEKVNSQPEADYVALGAYTYSIQNHSSETILFRISSLNISIDGKSAFHYSERAPEIIAPDFPQQTRLLLIDNPRKFRESDKVGLVKLSVEYDTVPSTGLRRQTQIVKYAMNWVEPSINGYKIKTPNMTPQLISQTSP